MRRRIAFTVAGFLVGYGAAYALFLADAVRADHFEALYQVVRPASLAAWLAFQHHSEILFLTAGVCGAAIGLVGSFARRRVRSPMQAT